MTGARVAIAAAAASVLMAIAAAPASAESQSLRAGAGRADITPPTGYFLMGWVRSDARAAGQLTRLFARSLVIERGGRKVALVAADLAGEATALEQPADAERLEHPTFVWQGGPAGQDRPLHRAFVTIQRRGARGWRTVDDDLGLRIL